MSSAGDPTARPPGRFARATHPPRRPLLSPKHVRRAALALSVVAVVLVVGTFGFYAIAGVGWVDAFYFESMLATGQGPPFPLTTDAAKIFASVMAFVSVGSVLTSVFFTLGPIAMRLWHEVAQHVEDEVRLVEEELHRPPGPP